MPEAIVRGVPINYEVVGNVGPCISLNPGSRRSFGELVSLARHISGAGFRVLLHDRRNCGASGIAIEPLGSEHEIWAEDLRELCEQLGFGQVYIGGSSAGARLALLFALRHPKATKGLLLWRLTGGSHAAGELAELYYGSFAKLAARGGMQAVCTSDHFAECISARPSNRDRLMQITSADFIKTMDLWKKSFLEASNQPVIGATEEELKALSIPVCLIAGNDVIHPPATARKFKALVPQTELHDDVVEKRPDNQLLPEWDRNEWVRAEPMIASIFGEFLRRHAAL
jgi:pimeloyl-ACP methyl ester carboxylesterase